MQLALAVHDDFDAERVGELLRLLEQSSDVDLLCVYCGKSAATWDHLFNNVTKKRYSGYGNRIFNLVPACRTCNEKKGSKHWRTFAKLVAIDFAAVELRLAAVEKRNDSERYPWDLIVSRHTALAAKYDKAQDELRAPAVDQLIERVAATSSLRDKDTTLCRISRRAPLNFYDRLYFRFAILFFASMNSKYLALVREMHDRARCVERRVGAGSSRLVEGS